jgi:mannose-6-phosphate isomerase-like protein (cupin superfamily)
VHCIGTFDETKFMVPQGTAQRSRGFERVSLVDQSVGSVHMAVGICRLAPNGSVESCVHAFEKGIYVLEGEVELQRDFEAFRLLPDDYALIPYGTRYACRNAGSHVARWLEMQAPQPKAPGGWQDTFFIDGPNWPGEVSRPNLDDPLVRMVGQFKQQGPQTPHGTNMRGLTVYLFMERQFGAQHFCMMRGELGVGGVCGLHDHTLEESYFVLSGEAEMEIEGTVYPLRPGVFAWTGVGASHAFFQTGSEPLRWIETQAPPFPPQHAVRNYARWDTLRKRSKS